MAPPDVRGAKPGDGPGPTGLAPDDVELLRLLATDLPSHAIARRLGISERTVRRRINVLCEQIGVRGRIEAAVWAARRRIV